MDDGWPCGPRCRSGRGGAGELRHAVRRGGNTTRRARPPARHAKTLLGVLEKLAAHPRRLGDLGDDFHITGHWHETMAQRQGTIRRETRFPKDASELILSSPHFFVGNPFNKTPRAVCTQNSHYDVLDLTTLPDDYLPRTNYVPACGAEEYEARTPKVGWREDWEDETKQSERSLPRNQP